MGLVSIGVVSSGLVAVSLGASAGVVAVGAGVQIGGAVGGVGAGVGLFSFGVGGSWSLRGWDHELGQWTGIGAETSDSSPPEAPKPERMPSFREYIASGTESGVIEARVGALPNGTRTLTHEASTRGEALPTLDIAEDAQTSLRNFGIGDAVHALVETQTHADGYREAKRQYLCVSVVPGVVPPPRSERAYGEIAESVWRYFTRGLLVAIIFAVLALIVILGHDRWLDTTTLTQRAQLTWKGKITHAEGMTFPPGTECSLTVNLRTDGNERTRGRVSVGCGKIQFLAASDAALTIEEHRTEQGFSYDFQDFETEKKPNHDDDNHDDGVPRVEIDTQRNSVAVKRSVDPQYWLTIVLEQPAVRTGVPLFPGRTPAR